MSGECDKCSEHTLECVCNLTVDDESDLDAVIIKRQLSEFIKRAQVVCKENAEERYKENYNKRIKSIQKWNDDNRKFLRESQKNYRETEKGKYASSKRNASRNNKFKSSCEDLSIEEKNIIGNFYKNCPIGYEVDHIIPICKGGKHCLSNLQYLTKEENRKKSGK